MNLEEKLKSEDTKLFNCLQRIKEFCTETWKTVLLPWFTSHNCNHSEEIVDLLAQILSPLENTPHFLSRHELFILLASAYLHDIGMQFLKVNEKSVETLTESDYNQIRKNHAEESFNIILKSVRKELERDDFHLPTCIDEEYIPVIALVSKGHSTDFFPDIIKEFQQDPRTPKGRKVRGDFLTALLMIADELDLQCKRVQFYETAKFTLSTYSKVHWYKHHYVDFLAIENGSIKIILRLPENSNSYANLIKELIEIKLIEQIEKVNTVFADSAFNTLRINPTINFEIKVDKTGVKRELPEEVVIELREVLRKEVPESILDFSSRKTIAAYPKPSLIFTGRRDEISRFEEVFANASFISIEGLGGIGKTEFTAKCIEKYIAKDRLVWFECLPDSKLDSLIESSGYSDVLKGENKTERAKYSGYRDLIERDSKIVILDNFQDVSDLSFKEFFKMSNNYLNKAKIILIARERPDAGVKIAPVELKGLKNDALVYAKRLIETYYADLTVDDDVLNNICDKVEGHPLV